jgi:hypothetical protein
LDCTQVEYALVDVLMVAVGAVLCGHLYNSPAPRKLNTLLKIRSPLFFRSGTPTITTTATCSRTSRRARGKRGCDPEERDGKSTDGSGS